MDATLEVEKNNYFQLSKLARIKVQNSQLFCSSNKTPNCMSDKEPNEEVLKWQLMMKAAVDFSAAAVLCDEMQIERMSMAIVFRSSE